ncbi:hypothetical protein [uncultured Formosa sp.]|uniref:hypothetical protein n=1 Tax=uncultured Formosa sp. TaxID=255435 RepID=UPI00262062ED|nr:hypothetical protein [uncultured Formosa sp.]
MDTLIIKNLSTSELITIGYSEFDKDNNINLISIVDKTDSLYIQSIKKVWKANRETHKIETVSNLIDINCINEAFSLLYYPKLK